MEQVETDLDKMAEKDGGRIQAPREEMNCKYYLSKLKPYYLEQEKRDENGELIRQYSPTTILQNFNPLPNKSI